MTMLTAIRRFVLCCGEVTPNRNLQWMTTLSPVVPITPHLYKGLSATETKRKTKAEAEDPPVRPVGQYAIIHSIASGGVRGGLDN